MRRFVLVALILVFAVVSTACHKVPAGNVGVKVYLLGGKKGVDHEILGVGRYAQWINVEFYNFPTYTQTVTWTNDMNEGKKGIDESITFQTVEGLSVKANVGMSFRIRPDGVATVFQKYRKGIDEITDLYLRNMVRDAFVDAASTREVESVYGEGKMALLKEAEDIIRDQVSEIGIDLERVYFVGDLVLPQNVIEAINLKIQATQRAQQRENELREAEAEAKKKIAEASGLAKSRLVRAEAEAEANRKIAASLSPTLIQYYSIEKWNGTLPLMTGGAIPMINIDSLQQRK
jgi:regulator of protease activity HflC (stomatin/prohibitin superfamily)